MMPRPAICRPLGIAAGSSLESPPSGPGTRHPHRKDHCTPGSVAGGLGSNWQSRCSSWTIHSSFRPLPGQGTGQCCRTWFASPDPHRGCLQTEGACKCEYGHGSHGHRYWSRGSRVTTHPRLHALDTLLSCCRAAAPSEVHCTEYCTRMTRRSAYGSAIPRHRCWSIRSMGTTPQLLGHQSGGMGTQTVAAHPQTPHDAGHPWTSGTGSVSWCAQWDRRPCDCTGGLLPERPHSLCPPRQGWASKCGFEFVGLPRSPAYIRPTRTTVSSHLLSRAHLGPGSGW